MVHPGRLLVGVVLVVLGVIFLLDRLGVVSAGALINGYWPLIFVAAGAFQLVVTRRPSAGPVITIVVGLALLAATLNLLPANVWQLFWPVVLIAVGLLFLAGVLSRGGLDRADGRDVVNVFSAFGGQRVASQSQQFRGASLTSFFGGATLDLRQAKLAPDGAVVDAMSAFGGVDILVPEGWPISLSGIPIFGGFDDKTAEGAGPRQGPELKVRGTALFGGVSVKNKT